MRKTFNWSIVIIFLLLFVMSGCTTSEKKKENSDKLSIFTTVYPLQFFTEQIGGEFVEVHSVYPPGSDEHTFEPSQKDMINLSESDLFIYIGLGLESFIQKALPILKNEGTKTLEVSKNLHIQEGTEDHEDHHEDHDGHDHGNHNHGDIDPHIWIDPIYSIDIAEQIKNTLTELLPEQKEYFHQQFEDVKTKLLDLDTSFKQITSNAKRKEFIVSHAAYGYWEERYGIKMIPVSGISSADEPSQKDLQNIVELAQKYNISYVLQEQNVNSKLLEIIKEEIGAKNILPLHNLSVLTDNDMKHGDDYFSLMEKNISSLNQALNE